MAAPVRPAGDVFLPAAGRGGAGAPGGGGKQIFGLDRRVVIAAIVVAAIAAYFIYRHYQNSSGSSATGSSTTSNIDPQTGFPYGSPEDQAALADQSGAAGGAGSGAPTPSASVPDFSGLQSDLEALTTAISGLNPSTSGQNTPGPLTIQIVPQQTTNPNTPQGSKTVVGAQTVKPTPGSGSIISPATSSTLAAIGSIGIDTGPNTTADSPSPGVSPAASRAALAVPEPAKSTGQASATHAGKTNVPKGGEPKT